MTTGERIKEIRLKRKKTLAEVAEATGTTSTNLSKYETGRIKNIPQAKINAIAKFLEVNPSILLGLDEPNDPSLILTVSEQLMMDDFRSLDPIDQETVAVLIRQLRKAAAERSDQNDLIQLHL